MNDANIPSKHEFVHGHVYAMSGGSPDHARLAAAVIGVAWGASADVRAALRR